MPWKRVLVILTILLCAFTFCGLASETVAYFYLNACETCNPEDTFAQTFRRITGMSAKDFDVAYHNVYSDAGSAAYEQATRGMTDEERKLPLLIIDGKAYAGDTSITVGLETQFGAASTDHRSILYFLTAPACEGCVQARKTVEALPAVIALETDGMLISSPVEIREVSISTEPDLAQALFSHYAVPDGNRYAPAIFMGSTYLCGAERIRTELPALLQTGAALGTPELKVQTDADNPPADIDIALLWGSVIAGATAGLNPCALSMLLAFTGALLAMRRQPLLPGLLYLLGKLLVYLGVGLFCADLWMRYAPDWLPLVSRLLMTAIGILLIVWNIMDAIHTREEQYGRVRNQLPAGLRGKLRRLIQRWAGIRGAGLIWMAILLGAVIAAGEFLCTGQLYVAVLIANVQHQGAVLPLIFYCAASLLPSLVLLLIISLSRKTLSSADWVLKHMPFIKALTAVMMVVVLFYIWLAK